MEGIIPTAPWISGLTKEQVSEVIRLRVASRVNPERCLEALRHQNWNHRLAYEDLVSTGLINEMDV